MDRYYDCCKSGACIYNLSGRDIPYNPAESDSVCEKNVEDRLVCGSDKLFCGNTSAEYKDMYGRTGMFKRNQQFCSSYRYDDQHERYDSDAYDCDYILLRQRQELILSLQHLP